MKTPSSLVVMYMAVALSTAACGSGSSAPFATYHDPAGAAVTPEPVATPVPTKRSYSTDVLFFNGTGTWSPETSGLDALLTQHGLSYDVVSSEQLNAMSVDELAEYGIILWPGGSGAQQVASLTSQTMVNLLEAVQVHGVGYIGFCAGAFMGVDPFKMMSHPTLDTYYLEEQGTPYAMTLTDFADGRSRDLLWYGGPVTPETKGGVIARYPNGQAAITQGWAGAGFMILSGPHIAVPGGAAGFGLNDSDGEDSDLAWELISAVLERTPFQAF